MTEGVSMMFCAEHNFYFGIGGVCGQCLKEADTVTGGGQWGQGPRFTVVEGFAEPTMLLPADPAERKAIPLTTGVLDYFPLALAEVARVSKAGNDQHNPGQALHWDRTKSLDHADCIGRHLIDRGSRDADGQRHSAKLAWRALALLQTELEDEAKAK
jgi:hypothetical protein